LHKGNDKDGVGTLWEHLKYSGDKKHRIMYCPFRNREANFSGDVKSLEKI
jgi:hypothetical protein